MAGAFCALASATVFGRAGRLDEADERFQVARELGELGRVRLVMSLLPLMEATAWEALGDEPRYLKLLGEGFEKMVEARNRANCWVAAPWRP